MSVKINFCNELVSGPVTAVEPTEGYAHVVTKITFKNEGDTTAQASAQIMGGDEAITIVSKIILTKRESGWEDTQVLQSGQTLVVNASPAGAVRCIVEGYYLLDVPAHARKGAGAVDEDYARMGRLEVSDSKLVQLTYLTLVELKRIRNILANGPDADPDKNNAAAEIESEL